MKKIILLITVIIGFWSTVDAQSYYKMWTGQAQFGGSEWIANLQMRDKTSTGIEFATSNDCRAFVTNAGVWGFFKPFETAQVTSFVNYLSKSPVTTMGVQGTLLSEKISVGEFKDETRNSIDLEAFGGYSNIYSRGDTYGLRLSSVDGKKIYMWDKVHFNQYFWTTLGPGRNNAPTINNNNAGKWLRIGSKGGLAFWGKEGVEADDKPQFVIDGTSLSANVPAYVRPNDKVVLFMGVASTDENDGWLGTQSNSGLHLGVNNGSSLFLGTDHNVYVNLGHTEIGKIRAELKNKYCMFVDKGILSEDYAIAPQSSWADFVFNKSYDLPTIPEVANYIKENKHLPNVPSSKQVAEEGYSQHEMNKILLQKIEELTLYTIQQHEVMNQQQKEIITLKQELDKLNK